MTSASLDKAIASVSANHNTEVAPNIFVVFGALGDLAQRKLIPALYRLRSRGYLGDKSLILGIGLEETDDAKFREKCRESLKAAGYGDAPKWSDDHVFYHCSANGDAADFMELSERLESLERDFDLPGNRSFYLSLPPRQFIPTIMALGEYGLSKSRGWTRLIVEKPFGRDLESACELNHAIHLSFDESQVYRIDHYLGKETVQNLLVFRFANAIFESLWNRQHVDSVQILVSEELGVEQRAGYYDRAGALRDMVQNHVAQLVSLIGMAVPASMDADSIRHEKVKVLQSISTIQPKDVVFGQYGPGKINGEDVPGYLQEDGVPQDSQTETYISMKLAIDNWRWQGVPFCIRTGKRLSKRLTQIAVTFRRPPVCLFNSLGSCLVHSNVLLITLQPDEGFSLYFDVKSPHEPLDLRTFPLSFNYSDHFDTIPEAYETLILDVLEGDQTLFVHSAEVEESWKVFGPVLEQPRTIQTYKSGSWGPSGAEQHYEAGAPEWLDLVR